jgi:hypothetical protein
MSETREELALHLLIDPDALDAEEVESARDFCAEQLDSLRDRAGLEGDGLVVLRYEGDDVTVAGRLVTDHVWGGMERFFLVDPDA